MSTTVATWGSFTWTAPVNNSENINYFAISGVGSGPQFATDKWNIPGQNGDFVKKMYTTGRSATVVGFLDCSSAANLKTAVDTMEAAVVAKATNTLTLGSGPTLADAFIEGITWGIMTGYSSRFQREFTINFSCATGSN